MSGLYARAVFFVSDAARARRYYTETLGFTLDWDSNDGVLQVSLLGFEVILNDTSTLTRHKTGCGRVFVGLEDDQGPALREHIARKRIQTVGVKWGRPTLVIRDMDGNEMFFWMPHDDFGDLGLPPIPTSGITEVGGG